MPGDGTVIYGSLIYADNWTNDNSPVGVYAFTAAGNPDVRPVRIDEFLTANGGGVYIGGKYHCINYIELWGMMSAEYNVYDTETWENEYRSEVDLTWISSDMTYDPVTQTVYGCFFNDAFDGYVFGTLDFKTGKRTAIADMPDMMYVMAANSKGEIYGVGRDGSLYRIDKVTGAVTLVGATGVQPYYIQSATFDLKTDKLYWAATTKDESAGLYLIDTATGRAELICDFPNNEEIAGLYVPAPLAADGAPAAAEGLAVSFEKGNTEGTVEFVVPQKTFGGDALTGEQSYTILLNNIVKVSGTASPGERVSKPVAVGEPGSYTVSVILSNGSGSGPVAREDVYIGKDAPKAVRDLTLASGEGANEIILTWNPPVETVHSGYMDSEALRYTVVRYPDGKTVAEKQKETRFTETVEAASLALYWYEVTPFVDDVRGVAAASDKILLGSAFDVPYLETFDTPESFDFYTVFDINRDGYKWGYGSSYKAAQFTSGFDAADDWMITPPVRLDKDYIYKVYFSTWCGSTVYPERLEVMLGKGATPESMTQTLVPPTIVNSTEGRTIETVVRVTESGDYSLGFHAISDEETFFMYVDSIGVEKAASVKVPDSVTALKVTPGENGRLEATVSFKAPAVAADGTALTALEKISVYRGGELIKEFAGPAPGEELSYTDTEGSQGDNTYRVTAANNVGEGLGAEVTVYLGIDVPDVPASVTLADVGGKAVLTWEPPVAGASGGYIDPSQLVYYVLRATDKALVGERISGLTFTDPMPVGKDQAVVGYYVFAESAAGVGMGLLSNTMLMGSPYALPFAESFKNARTEHPSWTVTKNDFGEWMIYEDGIYPDALPQDNDGGMLTYEVMTPGEETTIASGKISLAGSASPALEFYYYQDPLSDNKLTVEVSEDYGAYNAVRTFDFAALADLPEGWTKARIPLIDFVSAGHIQFALHAVGGSNRQSLHIDNIKVKDFIDHDLAIADFKAPAKMNVGEEGEIMVTVSNEGQTEAAGYTVELFRDGVRLAGAAGETLQSGGTHAYRFADTPDLGFPKNVVYQARIDYQADMNMANNGSDELSVPVVLPAWPVVTDLAGTDNAGSVVLTWSNPVLDGGITAPATDGAEQYEAFIIDNIGEWTVVDVDGSLTYGINSGPNSTLEYPNAGAAMAFQVFNPSEAGAPVVDSDGTPGSWAPYSGNQMFVAFADQDGANDDWLISPELPGTAQVISFYARSVTDTYGLESYEILASSTDKDIESFKRVDGAGASGKVPAAWTRITASLPEGTRYFAIRCTSEDCFAFLVDDITYLSAAAASVELNLKGFNVYRDNEKITPEPVAANTYTDAVGVAGEYRYTVTAVYDQGESAYSNAVTVTVGTVSVGDMASRQVEVRGAAGAIEIRNAADMNVCIYTFGGKLVHKGTGGCMMTVSVGRGEYIVVVGGMSEKVLVK